MRIAIVADIHGNLTAFDAVLADLRFTSPDLILHGGDLAGGGARSAAIIDQVRGLGWPGVVGNSDEMLFRPASLTDFAAQLPALQTMFEAIREMADAIREELGEERLAWLQALPGTQIHSPMALLHASPESLWSSPAHTATDAELESAYGGFGQPVAVYGHIHIPYIRNVPYIGRASGMIVANTGSVSLSYDGDVRASYLLLDDLAPTIRRVEYDVETEVKALADCGIPHSDWIAKMLYSASPQMP
jgi:predicted phosphodiesterase